MQRLKYSAFLLLCFTVNPVWSALKPAAVFSQPDSALGSEQKLDWVVGRAMFRRLWVTAPASTQAADGLGPLYNARQCNACHPNNGRGGIRDNAEIAPVSLLLKVDRPAKTDEEKQLIVSGSALNIPDALYGIQLQTAAIAGHESEAEIRVNYEPLIVKLAGGDKATLRQPSYHPAYSHYGKPDADMRLSPRIAPQLIGLGLLEKIPETVLLDSEDPQDENQDGISGRANRVNNGKDETLVVGRFGHKAGLASVDAQTQAAFSTDLGISTPLHPAGFGDCTELQSACMRAPDGNSERYQNLEANQQVVDLVNLYVKHLAVPPQRIKVTRDYHQGKKLFNTLGCIKCHTAEYQISTEGSSSVSKQKDQSIYPYTDLLLHDMGDALADYRSEGRADGHEWRTAPLWGIGLAKQVNPNAGFLHDGRARSILEAILWHGGEAETQRDAVVALPPALRLQLIKFIESL